MIDFLKDDIDLGTKMAKRRTINYLLERSHYVSNTFDKVEIEDDIIKIKMCFFAFGEGTNLLRFLKRRVFYFKYFVDTKNKKLIDSNFIGGKYDLTDKELQSLESKYHYQIKRGE